MPNTLSVCIQSAVHTLVVVEESGARKKNIRCQARWAPTRFRAGFDALQMRSQAQAEHLRLDTEYKTSRDRTTVLYNALLTAT